MSKGFGGIYVTPMQDRKKKTADIEVTTGGRNYGKSYELRKNSKEPIISTRSLVMTKEKYSK